MIVQACYLKTDHPNYFFFEMLASVFQSWVEKGIHVKFKGQTKKALTVYKRYQQRLQKALWHHYMTTKVFIGFLESSFQILSHFFVLFCFYSRCRDWGEKIKEILNAFLKNKQNVMMTNRIFVTDKSLLEALFLASTNPQYDKRLW